ncbi:GNAT family N-acetyltransferase (plasmid) [Staphylococcus xylosus]|uniref:GNAT family N-acetyltransferase n=1 Tax=Staphylococcus TaxID=1279 RepID=UPI001E4561C0|nr:GNAT family N-acetyltransferase [Staphylococcus gallinarum]MCD8872656.1 GNAT family N-acetyltransferase [Staphylococcus gallinarum]
MAIYFKKTILKNADFILDLQKQCFKNDFLEYKDYETSPYCETLEDLQHDITTNQHFTIFLEENIVGAFEIKEKHNSQHLYKIFISQNEQNNGIGKLTMKMIFEKFTNKNKWTVYTPHKNYRNHHFYESLGFEKYGEAILSDKLTLFKYVKYN